MSQSLIPGVRIAPLAASACLVLASGPAASQVIEEITVTAQKREQSIQDVPIAVSAYSAETLRDVQVRDLRDVQALNPSLILTSTQSEAAGTTARIRGVGTTGDNAGLESSVAVFVDGVYRNRNSVALTDLGELERIEVLRGPQGTLFGKNASAGLIQVITAGPDYEPNGYLEGELGSDSRGRIGFGYTGPIIDDTLAWRLDANWQKRDGYLDDVNTGEDYNDRDRYLLRGQLQWDPTDDLDIRIIGDWASREEQCCAAAPAIYGPTAAALVALGGTLADDPYDREIAVNEERGYQEDVDEWGLSAEINWDTEIGTLTSITAYREWDLLRSQDVDLTDVDILYRDIDGYDQDFETLTQELRLAGEWNDVNWMVGFFYVDEDLTLVDAIKAGAQYEIYADLLLGAPGTLSALTGIPQGQVFPEGSGAVKDDFSQEGESWAFFTHNTWAFADEWELTVGLRYTDEEKDLEASLLADNNGCLALLQNPGAPPAAIGLTCLPFFNPLVDAPRPQYGPFPGQATSYKGSRSDDEWTGTIALDWAFSDDYNIYASYGHGYKAGGYNLDRAGLNNPLLGSLPTVEDLEFDKETVDTYELGAKGQYLGGEITLNTAIFYSEFDDYQLNTFTGTGFVVNNLETVESKGIELESMWYVNDNFTFSANATYADTRYGDDVSNPNLADKRITNAPRWVVTSWARYEAPIEQNLVGYGVLNYRFNDDMNTGSDLDPEKKQAGYSLWNTTLGVKDADDAWRAEFWVQNIFDQDFQQVAVDGPLQSGSFYYFLGAPRTLGVNLRFNF